MKRHFLLHQLATILGLLLASPAVSYGQFFEFCDDFSKPARCQRDPFEERIETERHDFTQSTQTVGRGVVQMETGFTYFYKDENSEIEDTYATPEMLWRIGLSEDIEFRLRWNYGWRFLDDVKEKEGAQDLNWSFKLGMTGPAGFCPESALEIRSTAPTGGDDWSTGRVEFGLDYIYGWQLSERNDRCGLGVCVTNG